MVTQLRDYRIASGHLSDFLSAWREGVIVEQRRERLTRVTDPAR